MREKYIIKIDKNTKKITLEELGELSKEEFFLLTTNEYSNIIIEDISKGKEAVIEALRNSKIFPTYQTAKAIADTIIHMVKEDKYYEEILIDEKDYIQKSEEEGYEEEKAVFKNLNEDTEFIDIIDNDISRDDVDENVDIDELLQDGENINVSSGIKIAEDEIEKSSKSEDDI